MDAADSAEAQAEEAEGKSAGKELRIASLFGTAVRPAPAAGRPLPLLSRTPHSGDQAAAESESFQKGIDSSPFVIVNTKTPRLKSERFCVIITLEAGFT